MPTTHSYASRHQGPAAAELKFTERQFALYELIIVKNKGRGTVKNTKVIDRKNLSDDTATAQTWSEHGLFGRD